MAVKTTAIQWHWGTDDSGRESGAASVAAIALVACLIVLNAAFLTASSVRGERHKAQTVADLSALAGANQLLNGTAEPCMTARHVAKANGTTLEACTITELTVSTSISFGITPFTGQAVSVAGVEATEVYEEY